MLHYYTRDSSYILDYCVCHHDPTGSCDKPPTSPERKRERLWQQWRVPGRAVQFNHADGELQLCRSNPGAPPSTRRRRSDGSSGLRTTASTHHRLHALPLGAPRIIIHGMHPFGTESSGMTSMAVLSGGTALSRPCGKWAATCDQMLAYLPEGGVRYLIPIVCGHDW